MFGTPRLMEPEEFEKAIDNEFRLELDLASRLMEVHPRFRNEMWAGLVEILKAKYRPDGKCPSYFFDNAPKHLQREYKKIHNQICEIIYQKGVLYPVPEGLGL